MLQAEKADAIFTLNKSATEVQRKELDMFVESLKKLSTVSGILAGFSLSGVVIVVSFKAFFFLFSRLAAQRICRAACFYVKPVVSLCVLCVCVCVA